MSEIQNPAADPADGNVLAILTWLAVHRNTPHLELSSLGEQLQALTETPPPPEQTFKLLEILFSCLASRLETHTSQLNNSKLPLLRNIRQQVNALHDLLDKFSWAYENVYAQLVKLQGSAALPARQALEQAAFCLSKHLYISYLVSAPGVPGIWKRLHGIFLLSLDHAPLPLSPYYEALFLSCAQPASFSSRELEFIASYVSPHAQRLEISIEPPPNLAGVFWIDTNRDFPAFALSRRNPPPEYQVFYFSCRPLALQAESDLQALDAEQTPEALHLPAFAASRSGKGSLRRLIAFWGDPGKRRFPRRRQSHRATLCSGLERIWRILQTPEEIDETDLSQWMITNESPDGYALMHLQGKTGRIQVGDIMAIHLESGKEGQKQWQICLVRWAISENSQHIEIGLQVLAPEAIPCFLATPGTPENQAHTQALVLPELPPLRSQPTLVVAAGAIADLKRKLLLLIEKNNLEIREVRAQSLAEQTSKIEVFTIEADAS